MAALHAEWDQSGPISCPVVLTFHLPPPAVIERSDNAGRTWAPIARISTKIDRFEDWEWLDISRTRYRIMRPDGSRTSSVPVHQPREVRASETK